MADTPEMPYLAPWYQIQVKGRLSPGWLDWFGGLQIQYLENGETSLIGPVTDQMALQRVLDQLWYLGLTVLSVHRLDAEEEIFFLTQSKSYSIMILRRSNRLHFLFEMRPQSQIAESTYVLTSSEMNLPQQTYLIDAKES